MDDLAMLVGTGGTTGLPKGVMLTSRNLETMTALTLMGYPFSGRPAYLALAPLTHAAGVLCFPVMTQGGRIVVMPKPDVGEFLALIERERITHTFLPPTLIYMLLGHEAIGTTDLSSLQCFWYGAAPMSTARLEEALRVIGPMAQLFGQTEAPMMVSMLPPAEHYNADGTVATQRLASAGRPAPLVTVGIMDPETGAASPDRRARRDRRARLARDGRLLQEPRGDRGRVQTRLAPHGRHRLPRRGRLPVHRRSPQGHDHHRRLQRLLGRGRAGADAAPGGARLRGRRAARRQVGRAGHRRDRVERRGPARRAGRVRQGADRVREGAQAGRALAGTSALARRQGAQGATSGRSCCTIKLLRASQPTSRAVPRRPPAEPRRGWEHR